LRTVVILTEDNLIVNNNSGGERAFQVACIIKAMVLQFPACNEDGAAFGVYELLN
jgi:hypothetical protein